MFKTIFNNSKTDPEHPKNLKQANVALAERMDHLMRVNSIAARVGKLEVKTPVLVKNPTTILVKKRGSLRRTLGG